MGGMRKYCVPRGIGRMIESARDPEEAWRMMESYFDRETRMLDRSIEEILGYGRMVNDTQTLAHYSRRGEGGVNRGLIQLINGLIETSPISYEGSQ